MKILMLTSNSSLLDGINRHILIVAPAINNKDGFEVAVCSVMPPAELQEKLTAAGVKCYSLGFDNGHKLGILKAYRQVLDSFKPDIVHVHTMALMERVVNSIFGRNCRFIQTVHGISDPIPGKSVKKLLKYYTEVAINKIFNIRYNALCFISQGVRDALDKDQSPDTVRQVCYNPINFRRQLQKGLLQSELNLKKDTPIIGTACRIADVKAPELFTAVMCQVLSRVKEAHAVVMGDGDADIINRCKSIVEKYVVGLRFHWLGYRSNASELVQDLNCFVLTSKREGMPTAVIECFAAHTPVAMLQGEGGLKDLEMLNREFGPILTIADRNNPSELADKIAGIIGSPDKAISIAGNAFKVGRRHFDIDAVAEQLCRIYTEITG